MRIFITGGTGLIGRRIIADRIARGDEVILISRDRDHAAEVLAEDGFNDVKILEADPTRAGDWQNAIAGCDAVINLAGAGVADRRWTKGYKQVLVSSRVETTRRLAEAIQQADPAQRPTVFISGSAMGFYGDAGDRELDENAPPGDDFLAKLTVEWEQAATLVPLSSELGVAGSQARRAGIPPRVVLLRTGIVLDERGGPLPKMLLPFRLLAGGPIGSGRQWMSWIHWRDEVGLINLAIETADLRGPLNAVSPNPVRNRDFARTLGRVLHRPAIFPAPKFMLRIALGEVAGPLTSSQRVVPAKARQFGYQFKFPELEPALRSLLAR
jgi:uncharacterized protein